MFEVLTHSHPAFIPGTRLVGGPSGWRKKKGVWPVWFVAEVGRVETLKFGLALPWIAAQSLLTRMEIADVDFLERFLMQRAAEGGTVVHVVLFDKVFDVRGQKIDLLDRRYIHTPPHPRSSSLLAYLHPAMYWHIQIDTWVSCALAALAVNIGAHFVHVSTDLETPVAIL